MTISNASRAYFMQANMRTATEWRAIASYLETHVTTATIATLDDAIASLYPDPRDATYARHSFTTSIMINLAFPSDAVKAADVYLRDMIIAACQTEAGYLDAATRAYALDILGDVGY